MPDISKFSAVSESLFIPLYCRAVETESERPIIHDNKAVEIVRQLDPEFAKSDSKLCRSLAERRLPNKLAVTMSLRTRKFDGYVKEFLQRNEKVVVVNMGCGFDTRFVRVDDGSLEWYDMDFPEVMDVKGLFMEESDRYHFIRSSVLDFGWMDLLGEKKDRNFVFLAEGLFMYLDGDEVRKLVLEIQSRFPGAELVCEVSNSYWVKKMQKGYYRWKFQRKLHLSGDAVFKFGIEKSQDFEKWGEGIKFLDDWTYFEENEPKLGWFRLFKSFEILRRVQWIVHYKLI